MNTLKAVDDFIATEEILTDSIRLFHEGRRESYRTVAVELRKLLCDGDNSLLARLFSGLQLHPIQGYMNKEQEERWKKKFGRSIQDNLVFQIPATMHFDGKGGSRIVSLFDIKRDTIELEEWLSQPLLNKDITLRKFIRSISDKISAHSDKDYDDTLRLSRSVKLVKEDMHKQLTVAIGEYIIHIIGELMKEIPEEILEKVEHNDS